jgi:transcriptional regulator with XRE-family HTH domain
VEGVPEADSEHVGEDDELEALLAALADEVAPEQAAIDLLLEDAPVVEVPPAWSARASDRWIRVVGELDRATPQLGKLLRTARDQVGVGPREAAEILGWDTAAYQRLEEGRAPGSLMNVAPERLHRLARRLNIRLEPLASAVSMAVVAASGFGYGHRPRTGPTDPVITDKTGDRERLNAWARSVLVGDR